MYFRQEALEELQLMVGDWNVLEGLSVVLKVRSTFKPSVIRLM
jgi:hypothetical protein